MHAKRFKPHLDAKSSKKVSFLNVVISAHSGKVANRFLKTLTLISMNCRKIPFFESTARYVTETRCTSAEKQALLVNHGCDFARKAKHPSTITLLFPAHGLASNIPTS